MALARIFHQPGPKDQRMAYGYTASRKGAEVHFVPPAGAGAGGGRVASLRPRFAPIDSAIGLVGDAQICPGRPAP